VHRFHTVALDGAARAVEILDMQRRRPYKNSDTTNPVVVWLSLPWL